MVFIVSVAPDLFSALQQSEGNLMQSPQTIVNL